MRGVKSQALDSDCLSSNLGFDSSCVILGKLLNFSVLQPFFCLKKNELQPQPHKILGRITQDHAIYKKSLNSSLSPSPQPLHAGVCMTVVAFFVTRLFLGQ